MSDILPPNQPKPRLLTILFGTNDSFLSPHPRHVPIDEFRANIKSIVAMVAELSPETKVILITPPPLGEKLYATYYKTPFRDYETVKAYADVVRDIASELSLPCADLWSAIEIKAKDIGGELDGYDYFYHDGVHLSAGGNDLLFEVLMETIKNDLPELHHSSTRFAVPFHAEIDAAVADGKDVAEAVHMQSNH
ncbi:isoamyl acetate-hydrolyzing esterase [Coemansia aciculifera]|uniref:Isoamyl acetate-hydrolyzing esterase n=1 Tax=Coemansia aciculifera TaxID=417176 RepID=A0ACC1M3R0_9FUNG|nr:isoamyl acetate-hydrolyzing esterase [Coemansia aciculifera]